jgi:hypothetical protein
MQFLRLDDFQNLRRKLAFPHTNFSSYRMAGETPQYEVARLRIRPAVMKMAKRLEYWAGEFTEDAHTTKPLAKCHIGLSRIQL